MQFIRSLYIHNTFFRYLAVLAAIFVLSYWVSILYPIAWLLALLLIALLVFDVYLLYQGKKRLEAERLVPQKLSNSDLNTIRIEFRSTYPFKTFITVIDELPPQFQKRDFEHKASLGSGEYREFTYLVRPVERGEYVFGNLNIYASSPLKIVKRRFVFQKDEMVPVYPSIIQMQKYDFLAISNRYSEFGLKKNKANWPYPGV